MNEVFHREVKKLADIYPKLVIVEGNGSLFLKGSIDLKDEQNEIVDTYDIEIHPSPLFPYRFPYLYETGGRIPINIEWHRYEPSGICCVKIPAEEILICKEGLSLKDYIQKEVKPYFFNQTFRRLNGYFLNERRHGVLGIIDFYSEILKTKNIYIILKLLYFIRKNEEPERVALCFCGSGLKYRKCHREAFRLLVQVGQSQINRDIFEMEKALSLLNHTN